MAKIAWPVALFQNRAMQSSVILKNIKLIIKYIKNCFEFKANEKPKFVKNLRFLL